MLLANTNAPPLKNTADRIRYKVPIEVPVFGNSSSPAGAGVPCATGVGDGSFTSFVSFAGACSALLASGVANTRESVVDAFASATSVASTAFVKTAIGAGEVHDQDRQW